MDGVISYRSAYAVRTVASISPSLPCSNCTSSSLHFHCSSFHSSTTTIRRRRTTTTPPRFRNNHSAAVRCGAGIVEINESQFEDTVLNANRPVLVEFVAKWCGPCRLISPAIQSLAQVSLSLSFFLFHYKNDFEEKLFSLDLVFLL